MTGAADAGTDLVQIGVMADRVGLSLRTVRYYEEMGLVEPTTRTVGGFRLYGPQQETRLRILKAMKPLGYTLEEMNELVQMLDYTQRAQRGSRRAAALLDQVDSRRQEIALRRANLERQVDATQQISDALDAAARLLS